MIRTLRSRIALLLVAANLPAIALAISIGVNDFRSADLTDRDRLVQAAELIAARAVGLPEDKAAFTERWRSVVFRDGGSRARILAAVIAPDGSVLADESGAAAPEWLPKEGVPAKADPDDARLKRARGADGHAYRYAMAPIENASATVVAATPFDFLSRSRTQWLLLALGLPALMSLLGVGVVLFGVERFVLRWIRALRTRAAAYDGGLLDGRSVRLEGAPSELSELGESLAAMARRIDARSLELETAIEERDRILRELHHRVKNNFQMIASLLALQRQEAPETLDGVLRAPEDRVRAMAAAYKASYASGEIGHVGLGELVRDVALQVRQSHTTPGIRVTVDMADEAGELDLDRAVSLALLTAEILSAATIAASGDVVVKIATREAGTASLTFSGPAEGWMPRAGLSERLIRAYLLQLSTTADASAAGAITIVVALAQEKPSIGMKPASAAALPETR